MVSILLLNNSVSKIRTYSSRVRELANIHYDWVMLRMELELQELIGEGHVLFVGPGALVLFVDVGEGGGDLLPVLA